MVDVPSNEPIKEDVEQSPLQPDEVEATPESGEVVEDGEPVSEENIEALKQHIEAQQLDDGQRVQAQSQADDMASLEQTEKIEKLVQLAKKKGVVYAVQVAKKMGSPYVLDTLHDKLVEAGLYNNFSK